MVRVESASVAVAQLPV
jgi:hypothetical protein